ncbi:hypothetical protein [Streptomyces galbus]|uniref:hypothetical protein n=1 Tax=Streptomyces galbus TaxID=33898 RepID=UPI00199DDD9E|nr:hypothetical protein [Streptomyces galbus]GHD44893.1 hypothetical protein GCM10010335_49880 [Streptomyces galbus]
MTAQDFAASGFTTYGTVIKELLGHAHIGVYAHVRLRLPRQAIDAVSPHQQRP